MTEVGSITPVDKQPVAVVVELLEEMLEAARAGDIVAIGIAAAMSDGRPRKGKALPVRSYTVHENALVAAVGDLQFEILESRAARYTTGRSAG